MQPAYGNRDAGLLSCGAGQFAFTLRVKDLRPRSEDGLHSESSEVRLPQAKSALSVDTYPVAAADDIVAVA
jgi:hypothetical protein